MQKFFRYFLIVFLLTACLIPCYAKKKKEEFKDMVETKEEWLEQAKATPLESRKPEEKKYEFDEKTSKVEPPKAYIKRYNIPAGVWDMNLSTITKNYTQYSIKVASPDFKKFAVTYYYYIPSQNQIASELFIEPLTGFKSRTQKLIDAVVMDKDKGTNLVTGTYEFRENSFKTLTIVDWNSTSDLVLLKEKIGSFTSGVFTTNPIIAQRQENTTVYKRYPQLQEEILKYNREILGIAFNNYRWNIEVLGFNAHDNTKFIVRAVTWDNEKKKKTLGYWSVDVISGEVHRVRFGQPFDVSANGYCLFFEFD
ncbi:hypothetical protein IKA15_00515 [bacterium]|nr:hypothetical protein [bacterium]